MEFKKINDNTFECRLSKEDLEDYDISLEDFLKDKEKTLDFMRHIIEQSESEIDFEPAGGIMSMQITPLPGDGLALIFSNRQPLDGDIMSHVRDLIKNQIENIFQTPDFPSEDSSDAPGIPEPAPDITDITDLMRSLGESKPPKKEKAAPLPLTRKLFYFKSFKELEGFCKNCSPDKPVKSQILKKDGDDGYCLIVEKGRLLPKEYERMTESILEYGEFLTDDPVRIMNISEHSRIVIDKNAVSAIKNL